MSMQRIIEDLDRLRSRSRVMLLAQRFAVLLACSLAVVIALIGIDYALRLPATVRLVLLVGGIGVLGYAAWRYLFSAIRFHPTLTQLALRVEQALPPLAGRLASSVEFAASGIDQSNFMAARSVSEADARMAGESVTRIIRPGQTVRDIAALLAVIFAAGLFTWVNPAAAQTGAARILLPLGSAQWPNRTGVQSLMADVVVAGHVHPRGQALPLRAQVTRGDDAQRIDAMYRLEIDGEMRPWRHVVLTQQANGAVHERLVDTNADAIEVYFATADDRTEVERIALVPPPAIVRANLIALPPLYARNHVSPFEAEMGPGTDSRAAIERPLLIGSEVQLVLELNKPLPLPEDHAQLRNVLGWDDQSQLPAFTTNSTGTRWTLRWPLAASRDLSLLLVDEHGLMNAEPISYRIDAVQDHPPSVAIIEPQADQSVLASAVVPLVADAKDDVALSRLAMQANRPRNGNGNGDASADTAIEPLWSTEQSMSTMAGRLETDIDLGSLNLAEGDVLLVTAIAEDVYDLDGEARQPVTSAARRLRIISELDFATQLRRQLGVVRQNAMRIEMLQAELQDSIRESGVQPGSERAQAQIGERIAAQAEAVDAVRQQMRQNRLDDDQLEALLSQSRDLLDFAGRSANEAVEEIARRAAGETESEQAVTEAQQEVREELADLIQLLDRDEDTWVITRQLEGLLADQSRLAEQTSQLHDRTLGQSLEEMSPADLTELDRIARAQRDLRDDARQLVEDLRRRADAMQDADPQAASSMRRAADTAEQRELDRDMQSASDRAQQNQLRNAQSAQQAASQTMQRMLQDIEDNKRAQVEQLLRQLASLQESIDRLIFVQENELSALANAQATGNYTGRDRAMIRLNQNTQSVASEARAAGQQTRRIARTLDRAADAQGAAIVALRSDPLDHDAAEQAEVRSLELLKEAKQLAEELQEQAREEETRRRREELIAAYRETIERQVMLRAAALALAAEAGEQLNRRQLVEARRLGTQQEDLRIGLEDLQREVQEIDDSPLFAHVHRRIGQWSISASDGLAAGSVGIDITDRQQLITQSLGRLIEALEEAMRPPDEFASEEGEGGGEGGGGEQPLIPPVTELRLLMGLQEEVYDQTRLIDGRNDLNDAQRRDRLRDLGQLQRELMEMGQQMLERMQQ